MPVYEYECEGGHRFTETRRMVDRYSAICPKCRRQGRLKISLSSFRFAVPVTFVTPEHGAIKKLPDGGRAPPVRRYKDIPREV